MRFLGVNTSMAMTKRAKAITPKKMKYGSQFGPVWLLCTKRVPTPAATQIKTTRRMSIASTFAGVVRLMGRSVYNSVGGMSKTSSC